MQAYTFWLQRTASLDCNDCAPAVSENLFASVLDLCRSVCCVQPLSEWKDAARWLLVARILTRLSTVFTTIDPSMTCLSESATTRRRRRRRGRTWGRGGGVTGPV